MHRRWSAAALAVLLGACGAGDVQGTPASTTEPATTEPAMAAPAATVTAPPSTTVAVPVDVVEALATVVVEREHDGGYDRDLFVQWVDDDHDGCDTRQEVLAAERLDHGAGECGIIAASWWSPYDDGDHSDPADLEIDHLVPLKEAWDSGAWTWPDDRRRAFANDVGHPEVLVAVAGTENRAKGDKDPSNWLPPSEAARCGYAADWVRVKVVWGLSMDPSEAGRLGNVLADCPSGATLVGARPDPWPPAPASSIAAAPAPAPAPPLPIGPSAAGCHPSYDPCVDVASDVDCAGGRGNGPAYVGRVSVVGPDVYDLDRDGDGVGCE